jgi:hypothetical protein
MSLHLPAPLLCALLCACSASLLHAEGLGGGGIGGGGGGAAMGRTFTPTWTAASEAVAKAGRSANQVIVYAVEGDAKTITMWDQELTTMSQSTVFVQLTGAQAAEFAKRWQIDARPAVAIADAHGNVLWRESASITPGRVRSGIDESKTVAAALEKDLTQALAAAHKAYEQNAISTALQKLNKVLRFAGPHAADANALRDKIIADGMNQIDSGKQLASSDAKRAKEVLRGLLNSYRGTPVAEQASVALKDLE